MPEAPRHPPRRGPGAGPLPDAGPLGGAGGPATLPWEPGELGRRLEFSVVWYRIIESGIVSYGLIEFSIVYST